MSLYDHYKDEVAKILAVSIAIVVLFAAYVIIYCIESLTE